MEDTEFTRAERALLESVTDDLSALRVTDMATVLLGTVVGGVAVPPPERQPPPASWWRATALLYIGIHAVRTTRAAMVVIACGYTAEALAFKRIILELHSRARRVASDQSGEYARNWLDGRGGKPSKAVSGFSPSDLWSNLSQSAHADPRHVENFLAISEEEGTRIVVAPERRPEVDNSTLAVFAGEVRDIAAIIVSTVIGFSP